MLTNNLSIPTRLRAACVSSLLVGFLLVAGSVQSAGGSAPAAAHHDTAATKHGAEIFQKRCVVCHNKQPGDDAPFGPPNLYTLFRANPPLSSQEAETTIRNGKGNMPAFGNILSPSDIRSVIAYLRKR